MIHQEGRHLGIGNIRGAELLCDVWLLLPIAPPL
jgi:hypothetical protein